MAWESEMSTPPKLHSEYYGTLPLPLLTHREMVTTYAGCSCWRMLSDAVLPLETLSDKF